MDEDEILNIIKARLADIGYDYELLTPSQQRNLLSIETVLSRRLAEQQTALAALKDNKINVASISKVINITRKTIYNNEVLKDYIECVGKIYDSNYPVSGLADLKEQLTESKEIIDKMVRRDADVEKLKSEKAELEKEFLTYREQIKSLTESNLELAKKLRDCEQELKARTAFRIIK